MIQTSPMIINTLSTVVFTGFGMRVRIIKKSAQATKKEKKDVSDLLGMSCQIRTEVTRLT